jgi:hypothetical protein
LKDKQDGSSWFSLAAVLFFVVFAFSILHAFAFVQDGRYWSGKVNMREAISRREARWKAYALPAGKVSG